MKAKKQMSIDDLAVIVKKGFQEVGDTMATKEMAKSLVDDLVVMVKRGFDATASKEDLHILEQDMDRQFAGVNERLDRIEKIFMVDHKHRIERLEFEVNNLKDLFALK